MKHILIADDHSAIRKGVKQLLSDGFSSVEFGEASGAAEVFKRLKEKEWDLLILDIDMPGRNGLEVLHQLEAEHTKIPVLVFSMHPEEQISLRALKAGAMGYVSKNSVDEELIKAVQQVLSGKQYLPPSVAALMLEQMKHPENKPLHELLSDREYQTFILIAKGKQVSQIAKELSLSVPAISTFRHRLLEKMGMKNNADLINYAIRNNLVN
ncbi:MAG: response regulator transcription factor [Bacteroidetes bacterium]|nr:response regulator transcription factor [Bacteroidota bacterium]